MKSLLNIPLTISQKKVISAFNFKSFSDVLCNYPIRYECFLDYPYEQWKIGEYFHFQAQTIRVIQTFGFGKKMGVRFLVLKDGYQIKVSIFNRPWAKNIPLNHVISIYGKYTGKNNFLAVNYELKELSNHSLYEPIYHTKANLRQNTIQLFMQKILAESLPLVKETVPAIYRKKYKLIDRQTALLQIHQPKDENHLKQANRRLKYEEFLSFFTYLYGQKNNHYTNLKKPKRIDKDYLNQLVKQLPFVLTDDQLKVMLEILKDLNSVYKMNRLIQGDVGSGKTVIAALSALLCNKINYQAVLLAPTEILAKQHYDSVLSLLPKEKKTMALLYSGQPSKEKKAVLDGITNGHISFVIGTHALLQENVHFQNLGLVIVDEQQRFGVMQREILKEQSNEVDYLVMSATPIPRTLAAALYDGIDISSIHTMPIGRKVPITKYIAENSFRSVFKEVSELLNKGQQLYVVCATINDSEIKNNVRNVYETYQTLEKVFKEYHVGYIHGQMKADEKEKIMQDFLTNNIQILVSTTVIEVGMNCVNATGMIIYNSERFGLATLHQLRGRIQRGDKQGYCWLLTDSKDEETVNRLNVLVRSNDGFYIAKEDLRLRGPGDILGLRQSGLPSFILGNLINDQAYLDIAKKDAKDIINNLDNAENRYFYNHLLEEKKRYGY